MQEIRLLLIRKMNCCSMKRKYPLQWLEDIIFYFECQITDLSNENNQQGMSRPGINVVLAEAETEIAVIRSSIQSHVFKAAATKKSSKRLVKYYYNSLTYYMNILFDKCDDLENDSSQLHELSVILLEKLEKLINFLRSNYSSLIGKDQKVPKFYLQRCKVRMQNSIKLLRLRLEDVQNEHSQNVCSIVLDSMDEFVKTKKHPYQVTFNCVEYRLDLLQKIERLNSLESCAESNEFPLDKLLIYMNFNSRTYVSYLTKCITDTVNSSNDPIGTLCMHFKIIKQLQSKPSLVYNPTYHNLPDLLEKWFLNEIKYRRKFINNDFAKEPVSDETKTESVKTKKTKVTVTLSSDQIALFLRAADEMRILSARSMTEVFRTIVPYISTPYRDSLSYQGVRIQSYNPEEVDKEIIVNTLQKMIEKIRDY